MPLLKAALSPTTNVPAVRVVVPAKVLAWLRVWLPVPALLRLMLPEMSPEKALVCAPLSVRIAAAPELVTVPPAEAMSDRAPMVTELPSRSTVVPAPTETRLVVAPKAETLPTATLPAVRLKPPEKVLVPLSDRVPAPALVQPPVPETAPLSVRSVSAVTVRAAAPVANVPPKAIVPVSVASPNVMSPPRATLFAKTRAAEPTLLSLPALSVSELVPKAASFPARSTPAERVVVPA